MSLWEICMLVLGVLLGGAVSTLKAWLRREQPKRERTTLHSPGVLPAIVPQRVIERQEALHDEHDAIAVEDAQKRAQEAKPRGDIKGSVDELF